MFPVVLGALGDGIKALKVDLKKIFNNNKVVAVMQKTILMKVSSKELYLVLSKEKIMKCLF